MVAAKSVEQYIRAAPTETKAVLRKVRAAIREAAPNAEESISYGLPFYSYKREVGVERRLCYFGLKGESLGLYLRPKDLDPLAEQIAAFRTSKSALRFRLEKPIPIPLIKKLVRDADRRHRAEKAPIERRGSGRPGILKD
jgi:uncharacterized protein YdhG (YjbR/CyaY superfamily)